MSYSLQVMKMAEAEVPGPEVFWMSHWEQWEQLFFYMVVAKGNGVTAIVNTGPPTDLTELNLAWKAFAGPRCQMKRAEIERPEQALARLGIDPAAVDFVLLTPLQAYTTANLPFFRNATICCSRRGWVEDIVARAPVLHVPRHLCISDSVLQYLLFDAKDRLRLLDDEEEVCPGVRAWWAGTHHRSSMVYSFVTSVGTVMTGDCAMKYANVKGHPLGIAESIMEGETAYRRIRKEASIFLPLYDPEVLQRYPDGRIG
jgi:glyoxylase-like metal-dependent hydrolase (beta-lactamase superfamily II)